MPLIATSRDYLGRSLFVLPHYGYGWGRQDVGAPPKTQLDSLGPEPFNILVQDLVYCDQQLVGLSGAISESAHALNKYWCACLLRNTDESNFTTHPGQYLVWIAQKRLPIHPVPYPQEALFNWVRFDKNEFCLCGYGAVAESVQWVQRLYETAMASRKQVAGR
jgi:hypothetical protein